MEVYTLRPGQGGRGEFHSKAVNSEPDKTKTGIPTTGTPGYTLIELLATIAIISILVGSSLPSLSHLFESDTLASSINSLTGALARTRSESIKRNQQVVLCKSQDGESCSTQSRWEQGWIIFSDLDQDRDRDANEPVIQVQTHLSQLIQLDYRAFGSSNYIVYRPEGFTRTNGTFTFCVRNNPETARALILMKTGRVRLSTAKSDGSPLDC